MATNVQDRRTRKRASERISEMLDIVEARLIADRSAAVSMKDIGDAVGTSRALVYAYFPDQFRLLDAVLDRHIAWLSDDGIAAAAAHGDLLTRAQATSALYLRHVVVHGPTIGIVLRERATARQLNGAAARFRGSIYRQLANVARVELSMGAREALALIQLLEVIPEEAGRQVATGSLSLDEAIDINRRLIESSVESVRPNTSV